MNYRKKFNEWQTEESFQPFDPRKASDFSRDPFDSHLDSCPFDSTRFDRDNDGYADDDSDGHCSW